MPRDKAEFILAMGSQDRHGASYTMPINEVKGVTPLTPILPVAEDVSALYTSEWETGTVVTSACMYNPTTKTCYDIHCTDIDVGDTGLVREYVTLPDGTELDENDGVDFDY